MIYAYLMKFIIVGDSGVGKTSIMNRFVSDNYDEYISSTIGVDFGAKIINVDYNNKTVPIKVQIWDTAGLETFRSITKAYYKNAAGIIYVYDITNEYSFKNLDEWISNVKCETSDDFSSILVGTKTDNIYKRKVKYEDALRFAKKNKMEHIEVSSKDGDVDSVFKNLSIAILERVFKNNKIPDGVRQIDNRLQGDIQIYRDSYIPPPKCCVIQ